VHKHPLFFCAIKIRPITGAGWVTGPITWTVPSRDHGGFFIPAACDISSGLTCPYTFRRRQPIGSYAPSILEVGCRRSDVGFECWIRCHDQFSLSRNLRLGNRTA